VQGLPARRRAVAADARRHRRPRHRRGAQEPGAAAGGDRAAAHGIGMAAGGQWRRAAGAGGRRPRPRVRIHRAQLPGPRQRATALPPARLRPRLAFAGKQRPAQRQLHQPAAGRLPVPGDRGQQCGRVEPEPGDAALRHPADVPGNLAVPRADGRAAGDHRLCRVPPAAAAPCAATQPAGARGAGAHARAQRGQGAAREGQPDRSADRAAQRTLPRQPGAGRPRFLRTRPQARQRIQPGAGAGPGGGGHRRPGRAGAGRATARLAGARQRLRRALGRRLPAGIAAAARPSPGHRRRTHPRGLRRAALPARGRRAACVALRGRHGRVPVARRAPAGRGLGADGGTGRGRPALGAGARRQCLGDAAPGLACGPAADVARPVARRPRRPAAQRPPAPACLAGLRQPRGRAGMTVRIPLALRIVGFVAAYAAASAFAIRFNGPSQIAMYWPASGLAFAVVVVGGWRWALLVAPALLLKSLLFEPVPPGFLAFSIAGNLGGLLLGGGLARRETSLRPGSVRYAIRMMACGMLMSLVGGLVGGYGLWLTGLTDQLVASQLLWALGDFLGIASVAPALMIGAARWQRGQLRSSQPELSGERSLWNIALVSSYLLMAWGMRASGAFALGLTTLPLAAMLWGAVRFTPMRTAVSVMVTVALIAMLAAHGEAGFPRPSGTLETTILLGYLCLLAILPQALALSVDEHRGLNRRLQRRANTDPLSGLPNRGAFEAAARVAMEDPSSTSLALAYLDLDNLKLV